MRFRGRKKRTRKGSFKRRMKRYAKGGARKLMSYVSTRGGIRL